MCEPYELQTRKKKKKTYVVRNLGKLKDKK